MSNSERETLDMDELKQAGLAAKLVRVMKSVDEIEKKGTHEQGYGFVRSSDVAREVRKALVQENVAFLFETSDPEHQVFERPNKSPMILTTLRGMVTFVDGDTGAEYKLPVTGTGSDYGGDKGVYKAITSMVKAALRSTFLIPDADLDVEHTQDGDQAYEPIAAVVEPPSVPQEPRTATLATDRQKAHLRALGRDKGLTDEQFKATVAAVVGKTTSKELTGADYETLVSFLNDVKPIVESLPF